MGGLGVKRRASSDPLHGERPTKKPALDLALKNMHYVLDGALRNIPLDLLSQRVAKCTLEFLRDAPVDLFANVVAEQSSIDSGYLADSSSNSDMHSFDSDISSDSGSQSGYLPDAPVDSTPNVFFMHSGSVSSSGRGNQSSGGESGYSPDTPMLSDNGSDSDSSSGRGNQSAGGESGYSPDTSMLSDNGSDSNSNPEGSIEVPRRITNHCIIRLTFEKVQDTATVSSPAGTRGVTIDCHYTQADKYEGRFISPSTMQVNTFTHEGPHRLCLHEVDIPVRKRRHNWNYILAEFLRDIIEKSMTPVAFTADEEEQGLHGCRDFTSQLIQHWSNRGLVYLGGGSWGQLYNITFGIGGEVVPAPIIRASFNPNYVRIAVPGIEYEPPADPRWDPSRM